MDLDKLLNTIMTKYSDKLSGSRVFAEVTDKIARNKATYADAYDLAREVGRSLTDILREHLPEVLVDGKLPKDIANAIIRPSMVQACSDVTGNTAAIQLQLNERANIGIRAIEPEINIDQINGIISGITGDNDYDAQIKTTADRIENFYEGHVDDFVHDNAQFQMDAGLSPKIERTATGKCCSWCEALLGKYEYKKVSDTGNDVFRRHKNCHCLVLFDPGDGSKNRQNVHTKEWT